MTDNADLMTLTRKHFLVYFLPSCSFAFHVTIWLNQAWANYGSGCGPLGFLIWSAKLNFPSVCFGNTQSNYILFADLPILLWSDLLDKHRQAVVSVERYSTLWSVN